MLLLELLLLAAVLVVAALATRNHRDYRRPEPREFGEGEPLVSLLVPARNEAANIEPCLRGLLAQDYPNREILVLDDGSTDGTGEIATRVLKDFGAGRVLAGLPLPPGWAGKCHACTQLAAAARGEWLLFVDADTRHEPTLVRAAMTAIGETDADFLSTFPRQEIGSLGEALVVPLMYWVVFTLLPMGRVSHDPNPALAAACGQFLLVRRSAYEATGGHAELRHSLHDGLHLARLFKQRGYRVSLADLSDRISCRMYHGWRQCWDGFSRNSFQAFGSYPALISVMLIEIALFLAPFFALVAAVASGRVWELGLALAAVLMLFAVQASLKRRFRYPWVSALLFPFGMTLLLAIQVRSAWRHSRRRPVEWKGRVAVPAES